MSTPLIDPKEMVPAAIGFVLGLALIAGFALLAISLNMPLFVEHANIPRQ